ncbi:tetratricopeptide repeat protein [bacterium]|nr:tetratricopeptide repeat protein [bacterium]
MSLQLAEQFEANEQYDQAYEAYKAAHQQNPDDLGILERLGHIALILDKKDEAADHYNEILKKDLTNALAYEQLISIYENTNRYKYYVYRGNKNSLEGKLEFAINDFKKAVAAATEPTQAAMTRLALANLYRQTGNEMKAIDEYNMLLSGDELHEEMFLQLADIYLKEEAYPSAVDTLLKAKQKGFDSLRINEGLAAVYLKSGRADKAIECTKDPLVTIQCMLELGQGKEAFEKLNALPEEVKKHPRYYTLMAQYYYSSKDFDKALETIDLYNQVVPNSPLTYQMRALVFDEKGDEYNSYLNWGRYHILRKDIDMATHEFLNAVQIKDDDVDLLFELAQILETNGEVDHASEYYEKIVKIDPKNKEALKKLAQYREGLGDYRMQAYFLEKAYEVDSRDLTLMKNLAKAYEKNRANSRAVEILTRYLDLVSDPVEIKMVQEKLNKLESLGASDAQESEGLIDKIMRFFSRK